MADRMEKPDVVMVDDLDEKNPSSDNEKAPQARTIDNIRVLGLTDDDAEFYNNFTPEQRKTVIKKVCCSAPRDHQQVTNYYRCRLIVDWFPCLPSST